MGTAFSIVLSFITTFILNKNLNAEQLGQYYYVLSVANFLFPLLSLSLYATYLRFETMYDSYLLERFVIKSSLISCIVFSVFLFVIFEDIYYAFYSFIILFSERLYLLRSQNKIYEYNIVNNAQKLLLLILVFHFVDDLSSAVVVFYSGISYMTISLLVWLFRNNKIELKSKGTQEISYKTILRFGFTTSVIALVSWVSTLSDQLVIKYYLGYEALAPYAVANRMVATVALLAGIFISYYPVFYYREMDNKNKQTIALFQKGFIAALLLVSLVFIQAREFVYYAFGAEKYVETSMLLTVLIIGDVLRLIASVFMTFRTYKLQQKVILICLFSVSVLNFILNIILVPTYGVIAAAWTTLVTYSIYLLISYFVSYRPEKNFLSQI